MTDVEKAIDYCRKSKRFFRDLASTEHNRIMDLAISAIEKQIPKKAIKNSEGNMICPTCQDTIHDIDVFFCSECGQRLE